MFFEEKKIFSLKDQETFSLISGDYNSIHLDKTKSRKSIFGDVGRNLGFAQGGALRFLHPSQQFPFPAPSTVISLAL